MEVADYIDELERAGTQLARAARYAGFEAAVPSCPGWSVADLLRHITKVHHRTISILQGGPHDAFSFDRPGDDVLGGVYDEGLARLLAALRAARPTLEVWTFLPTESPLTFWARRQAHETAIHQVDAELATGTGVAEFEAAFAADGLAELLVGFAPSAFSTEGVEGVRTITVTPVDANRGWTLTLAPAPASVATAEQAVDGSDLALFGTASDLYRWCWNRAGDDEVALRGDLSLADLWHRNFRIGSRRT